MNRTSERLERHTEADPHRGKSERQQNAPDAFETMKAYARQELLDPLSGMTRWLALGLLGSIFVATGIMLMVMALLRGLQNRNRHSFQRQLVMGALRCRYGCHVAVDRGHAASDKQAKPVMINTAASDPERITRDHAGRVFEGSAERYQ